MQRHDYLNKEFVESFYYNTKNECRTDEIQFVKNGRKYSKMGEYQPVYVVGVLHEVENIETHEKNLMLLVGVEKQPINKLDVCEKCMYSKAEENAYFSPYMIIKEVDDMDDLIFEELASSLVYTMKLDFMMTKEEIDIENEHRYNCVKSFVEENCCDCDDCNI